MIIGTFYTTPIYLFTLFICTLSFNITYLNKIFWAKAMFDVCSICNTINFELVRTRSAIAHITINIVIKLRCTFPPNSLTLLAYILLLCLCFNMRYPTPLFSFQCPKYFTVSLHATFDIRLSAYALLFSSLVLTMFNFLGNKLHTSLFLAFPPFIRSSFVHITQPHTSLFCSKFNLPFHIYLLMLPF